jgi:hypothetical protein
MALGDAGVGGVKRIYGVAGDFLDGKQHERKDDVVVQFTGVLPLIVLPSILSRLGIEVNSKGCTRQRSQTSPEQSCLDTLRKVPI